MIRPNCGCVCKWNGRLGPVSLCQTHVTRTIVSDTRHTSLLGSRTLYQTHVIPWVLYHCVRHTSHVPLCQTHVTRHSFGPVPLCQTHVTRHSLGPIPLCQTHVTPWVLYRYVRHVTRHSFDPVPLCQTHVTRHSLGPVPLCQTYVTPLVLYRCDRHMSHDTLWVLYRYVRHMSHVTPGVLYRYVRHMSHVTPWVLYRYVRHMSHVTPWVLYQCVRHTSHSQFVAVVIRHFCCGRTAGRMSLHSRNRSSAILNQFTSGHERREGRHTKHCHSAESRHCQGILQSQSPFLLH